MQNSLHFDELFDTKFKIQNPQNPEHLTLPENSSLCLDYCHPSFWRIFWHLIQNFIRENSSNFVYILTEEYRTSFILTQKFKINSYLLQKEFYTLEMSFPNGSQNNGNPMFIFGVQVGSFGRQILQHFQLAIISR